MGKIKFYGIVIDDIYRPLHKFEASSLEEAFNERDYFREGCERPESINLITYEGYIRNHKYAGKQYVITGIWRDKE